LKIKLKIYNSNFKVRYTCVATPYIGVRNAIDIKITLKFYSMWLHPKERERPIGRKIT